MPDSQTTPTNQAGTPSRPVELPVRWWSRLSPWLWGLVVLLVTAAIVITQLPRIASTSPASSLAGTAATPRLAGPAYTQTRATSQNFVKANLRGARLIDLDLRGKSFMGAEAAGADFAGSLLNGVNFSHADLRGADLRDACLRGANLTHAAIAGADFTGADITGANIASDATSVTIGWDSASTVPRCPGN